MKISLVIPKGQNRRSFLNKELSACRNIKDKNTRQSIETGLRKIIQNLTDSHAYYWDGDKLDHFQQPFDEFIYHCGKDFKFPEIPDINNRFGFIVMDANSCIISELRGKKFVKLWEKESMVPRKQDAGGQSAKRYQRNRELALNKWYKTIAEKMKEFWLVS